MTNEVRHQVFVSSTYRDLVDERQAIMSALLQLGALPAGMELFPVADDDAWALIRRVIDESDYYLLVIGGRYGSTDVEGIGYTEKEFDYATAQRKPVMAFLHETPEDLPFKNHEATATARKKLEEFRKRVQNSKHVKFWRTPDDLAGKIALSFTAFTRTYPTPGWVRGDAGDSPETLRKLAKAQERIADLESLLQADALNPPAGADSLAHDDERLEITLEVPFNLENLVSPRIHPRQECDVDTYLSWNEILFALGPLMVDEATQNSLSRRFKETVKSIRREMVDEAIHEWIKLHILDEHGDSFAGEEPVFRPTLTTPDHYFETALLQLQGLGIIQHGTKKRTASDSNTYWTLTPWGTTKLTQLRSVPSGQTAPPSLDTSLIY